MSTRTDRASTLRSDEVHGHVSKGFEPVREAFAENFSCRKELGARRVQKPERHAAAW